jgi:hypothetical protein
MSLGIRNDGVLACLFGSWLHTYLLSGVIKKLSSESTTTTEACCIKVWHARRFRRH